jgi:N-acetylneuraminic acid mutarotase
MAKLPDGALPSYVAATAAATPGNVPIYGAWNGQRFVVFEFTGGVSGAIYDPCTDSWSRVSDARPASLAQPISAKLGVLGNRVLSLVTNIAGTELATPQVFALDLVQNSWSMIPVLAAADADPTGEIVTFDDGESNTVTRDPPSAEVVLTNDFWRLGARGIAPVGKLPATRYPISSDGATVARVGQHFVVWSGELHLDPTHWVEDQAPYATLGAGGWSFDATAGSWSNLPTAGSPSPRAWAQAAAAGSKLYVWGGATKADFTHGMLEVASDGAILDADTGAWSPMVSDGAPAAREYATTLWTGAGLFVWGGVAPGASPGGNVPLGDGGFYDASKNRWHALATVGAPAPPSPSSTPAYSAFPGADGRVVMFDGSTSTAYAYDLVADAWTKLDLGLGEPTGRTGMLRFWTGRTMYVWGGSRSLPVNCPSPTPGTPSCNPSTSYQFFADGAGYSP